MIRPLLFAGMVIAAMGVAAPPAATASATSGAATAESGETSHLGATWDAPDTKSRVRDPQAVTATVQADTVLTPTDNSRCDLYTTTYTLQWVAKPGHKLTAVVTEEDNFGMGWRALDTDIWTMSPAGQVFDEQSPVLRNWFRKGTHHSDSKLCPRDTRTVNHVEIYVDGAPRHESTKSIVRPPSRNHLAAVWTWPGKVVVVPPARVDVDLSFYREVESSVDLCEAHMTELDVTVRALGDARIIAVGERSPGQEIRYQRGDATDFGRGVVSHRWFLTGTHTRSERCPADTLSQDRIEIYTDEGSRR